GPGVGGGGAHPPPAPPPPRRCPRAPPRLSATSTCGGGPLLPRRTRFERFLIEHDLVLLRSEHISRDRHRIVVRHSGRANDLAVSFRNGRPTRAAMKKLAHTLLGRAP